MCLVGVHNTEYFVDEDHGGASNNKPQMGAADKNRRRISVIKPSTSRSDDDLSSMKDNSTSASKTPLNGRMAVSRIVGPEAYYMGIVDFQQKYDFSKKVQ